MICTTMLSVGKSQRKLACTARKSLHSPEHRWGCSSCTCAAASTVCSFCWPKPSFISSPHHTNFPHEHFKKGGFVLPCFRRYVHKGKSHDFSRNWRNTGKTSLGSSSSTLWCWEFRLACPEMMSTCWDSCYALRAMLQSIHVVVPRLTAPEVSLPLLQWHLWWQRRCLLLLHTSECWDCFVLLWGHEAKVSKHLPVSWNGW